MDVCDDADDRDMEEEPESRFKDRFLKSSCRQKSVV